MKEEAKKLEKLGALWERKSKSGNTFLSGVIGEQRLEYQELRRKGRESKASKKALP